MPIDPTELAKSIGASAPWTPNRAWPRPCSRSPRRPSSCSPPMGRAHAGRRQRPAALGRASDQTAQTIENGQERLAQGPCAVAFSQRLPAAIHNIHIESDWQEFTRVLLGEGICAALSVPVELDGGCSAPWTSPPPSRGTGSPARSRPCRPMAGWWPACSRRRRPPSRVKGRLADQLQAALEHRWLIEQAKGVVMGREQLDAQAAFERLRGAARSSTRRLADVAKDVTAGQPLPADRRKLAKARAGQAKERETGS